MYACSNPHIIANGNGIGIFKPLITAFNIQRVSCGIKSTVRGDKYVVSKGDLGTVQYYRIVISKEIFADFDIMDFAF